MSRLSKSAIGRQIKVSIEKQTLYLVEDSQVIKQYLVSTASKGAGELNGSGCTPRGRHKIRLKIGYGCNTNTVFQGRRPTGEIYSPELALKFPDRDWILSRIIWLTGIESGINRGGQVDTLKRYIYLHGCPDKEPMGTPQSHGCIRMRNEDIIELFDLVENNMTVDIAD